MYGHPFLVWGNPGSLRQIESWGFKTFAGLFDQSYDLESDVTKRLELVIAQIQNFKTVPQSSIKNTRHNFFRFWDSKVVRQYYYEDLILPILKFIAE